MREIMNAKQAQVHPWNPSQGWLRLSDPWLNCRLEAKALIEQGFEPASDICDNVKFAKKR